MSSNICIIVPCYNEAVRLDSGQFIRFAAANSRIQFVMVNDGSQDETLHVLKKLQQRLPQQIAVVDLIENFGKAEAVRQGMLHGLNNAPDYIGYWDADLATPLDAIPEFEHVLDTRDDMDLVVASRLPLLGRRIQRHWLRQKIGKACAGMASTALGIRLQDTQCGAKLFRVTPVTSHVFSTPLGSRWLFDVELFARLIRTWKALEDRPFSRRVFEFPLQRWDEVPGSTLRKMDFFRAGLELWSIYWRYLNPLARLPDVSTIEEQVESARTILPFKKRAA